MQARYAAVGALLLTVAASVTPTSMAATAELKVLTAGAYRQVVVALVPEFEKQTGHTVTVVNDTAGALARRIEGGEAFDVVVVTPAVIEDLVKKGKVASGSQTNLAKVGVGVMVKAGAPRPEVGTVDAFKRALLDAKSVAYIDPASGGSSGIYIERLLERLGIADQIKPKSKLKQGGYVADLIVSGEAELGIHQISEIMPVAGVTLVGPLPADIQNYTTYAAGVGAGAKDREAATRFIKVLSGPTAAPVLKSKGMEAAAS